MCALAAHRQATAAWLHGDILTLGDTQHFLLDGLPLSRSEFQQVIFLRMRAAATFCLVFVVILIFFGSRFSNTADFYYSNRVTLLYSVGDPNPHVFGPPGFGSISQRYGS